MNQRTEKILKIGPVIIFFVFIIFYSLFVSRAIVFGIKIKDVNIESGASFAEGIIEVSGRAKSAVHIDLNGREISIDQAGNFREKVALSPGYNIIRIRALDKFGYVDEKNYQVTRSTEL